MHWSVIFAALATLAIPISGCTGPVSNPSTLAAMKLEALVLMEAHQTSETVLLSNDDWPRAMASLKPQAVSVEQSGVNILVKPNFDGGYGYFVPRKGERLPGPAERYTGLTSYIYWYRPY